MFDNMKLSYKIRSNLLKSTGAKIGAGAKIAPTAMVLKGVELGKNVEVRDYSKLIAVSVSDRSVIDIGALLLGVYRSKFTIGKESYIGFYAVLDGSGGLEIGDHVHIASPAVGIWTHTSVFQALTGAGHNDDTLRKEAPVKIEDNIWIGGNSIIYPGVTIGHHSVVFPNSTVTTDIPPNSMAGGSPAKVLKKVSIKKNKVTFLPIDKK
jgi:acetyltransferase-like isoleucine patch superfamily enzyme